MGQWDGKVRVVRRPGTWRRVLGIGLAAIALLSLAMLWVFRDELRSPAALYQRAQSAGPRRAAALYGRLAEKLPEIEEYARLWAAERAMPDLEAMRTLEDVVAYRPESPAAYEAQVAMARHYARTQAAAAEEAYRAALALHDTVALRQELAHYLEEQGDNERAYAEYRQILKKQADAFSGMRRTGQDPLAVAQDLNAATYYSDALETVRGIDDPEALPVRAQALAGLGRDEEAEAVYRDWLDDAPDNATAQYGLARVLARLGRTKEALSLYEAVETPDSELARAELLEEPEPEQALALYLDSPYPIAWWSATTMLEAQGRLTETLPLYARLAESGTYLADDAAYRLYVLAQREGDQEVQAEAKALLDGFGLNWLALRASESEVKLSISPPLAAAGGELFEKAGALSSIGREDLAHLELVFAAQSQHAPETKLAVVEELAREGHIAEAQFAAEGYVNVHGRAPLAFWQLSYPRPYSDTVQVAAAEYGVDPLLIWAVMREESRYDPEALSYVGARGLMQVMPSTQEWIAEELGKQIAPGDAYDPETSIRMGAWFLRFLSDHFQGDLELVIAAYNGGAGSMDSWLADPLVSNRDDLLRWIGYGETREYLSRVSLSYRVYRALYGEESNLGTQ
jgi:soluble lytic murein transglycosylase